MPPINLLIKPASGLCNMRCDYCFYMDETEKRSQASFGMMSTETLQNVIHKALDFAQPNNDCTIAFQGGEPTLIGLPFFQQVVKIQQSKLHELSQSQSQSQRPRIHNAIQTNGMLINDDWAEFFAENNFLVGLSLDGIKDTHDAFRHYPNGSGTYKQAIKAADILQKHNVQYNLLTVVNSQTAKRIRSIYSFFRENNFPWQQYIPCLNPLDDPSRYPFTLTPKAYTAFLKTLFDLWFEDIENHRPISIRQFDNYVSMLAGHPPEQCGMSGVCGYQNVVEADGSVYPCDFYVLDDYCLGNLNSQNFDEIYSKRVEIAFIENSLSVHNDCTKCKWYPLCRGGCRRHREPDLALNIFCPSYKEFFPYAIERLEYLVNKMAIK